jgi:hypothetical protein
VLKCGLWKYSTKQWVGEIMEATGPAAPPPLTCVAERLDDTGEPHSYPVRDTPDVLEEGGSWLLVACF